MRVLLCSTDLMIASMLEGAARGASCELVVAPPARVSEAASPTAGGAPGLVVIDLAAADDVGALVAAIRLAAPGARLLAFGPHVHREKLERARAAGCDSVMSRGQFHHSAQAILAELSGGDAARG